MIKEVDFVNFKSLAQNQIHFRNLTVLAGANSVGKSSTIQAVLLVKSVIEKIQSKNLSSSSGEISIPLNGPYLLSLGSTKEAISWETGKKFSISVGCNEGNIRFDFEASDLEETNFFTKVSYPQIADSELNIVKNNLYYLNAERLGPRIRHSVNENPTITDCGYQGQYTIEILARLGDEPDFVPQSKFLQGQKLPGIQSLNRYTQQWLDFIIPGTDLSSLQILGNIRSASVKFNSFFSAPNVGFGVSYILPIIVTALIASPNSILIVENPEAHLHPKGQSSIGYFLGSMAKAGIQIIIETHSEHVINGIRLSAIEDKSFDSGNFLINFYQGKENRTVKIDELTINPKGSLSDFPIDFFDQSQQDLLKIMTLSR